MKIEFHVEDYETYCSYDGCKENSIVNCLLNSEELHLCKKHFDENVMVLEQNCIENNSEKIYKYLSKIEEQKNRIPGSPLKISSFDDYYK